MNIKRKSSEGSLLAPPVGVKGRPDDSPYDVVCHSIGV